jgi:predicted HicB family RNase H-like nuclease
MAYLKHKGYSGTIEPQIEANILYGKILFINDLITYESENLAGLQKEFELSIDDYINFCKEHNKEPNKPFKGSFNIRITPELHQAAALAANGSLNAFVGQAIKNEVERVSRCE